MFLWRTVGKFLVIIEKRGSVDQHIQLGNFPDAAKIVKAEYKR